MLIVLSSVNKEGGDVGVLPWGSRSPMAGDNFGLLKMSPSGMQRVEREQRRVNQETPCFLGLLVLQP